MIILEIRSLSSPDCDPATWAPASAKDVYVLVELEVGERGVEGADLFQMVVATPEALRAKASDEVVIRNRATLVVSRFFWPDIREAIERTVASCAAENWSQSVLKLQRYFRWEYDDYSRW